MTNVARLPVAAQEIKIEDGIPLPAPIVSKANGMTATLRALLVGQSFVVPTIRNDLKLTRGRVYQLTGQGRVNGKFATRIIEENGVRVVRVWRVA